MVYGPCITADMASKIQRVENSCLRLIHGVRKYEHISHKLKELKWLNMHNRQTLEAACFYHKIIIEKCPAYLYNKISYRTDIHNQNLRQIYHYSTTPSHFPI